MSSRTVFIGNLPPASCEGDLVDLFAGYGCSHVQVVVRGEDFAYVEVDDEHALRAIAGLHESSFRDRHLVVAEAGARGVSDR